MKFKPVYCYDGGDYAYLGGYSITYDYRTGEEKSRSPISWNVRIEGGGYRPAGYEQVHYDSSIALAFPPKADTERSKQYTDKDQFVVVRHLVNGLKALKNLFIKTNESRDSRQ